MYANNAGYTKKVTVYAISYIGYCVGNLIGAGLSPLDGPGQSDPSTGPQTFKASQAPRYASGVAAMLSCYAVAMFLIAVVRQFPAVTFIMLQLTKVLMMASSCSTGFTSYI